MCLKKYPLSFNCKINKEITLIIEYNNIDTSSGLNTERTHTGMNDWQRKEVLPLASKNGISEKIYLHVQGDAVTTNAAVFTDDGDAKIKQI